MKLELALKGMTMLSLVENMNLILFLAFTAMYFYQMVYVVVALFYKHNKSSHYISKKMHKYAAVIAARNEGAVIGELIKSIKEQKYPSELVDIFVIADNCTDNTAEIARSLGAIVYERNNLQLIGKGYALNYLFNIIKYSHSEKEYEGYFVFDADNLLDENYIAEMNKVFDSGYKIVTSYRNSKNYGSNWITAGYSLWFLRESAYLNHPRMLLKTSCAVSGTGFLVHSDIISKNDGWKHHLLTEDIEFSVDSVINGETIGYCENAKIYDEQPTTFMQSWNQRLRWSKGFYQVFSKYGSSLIKSIFSINVNSFSSYDMLMTIVPVLLVSVLGIMINFTFLIYGLFNIHIMIRLISVATTSIICSLGNFYFVLYGLGLLTTITEWNQISCSKLKKVLYTFTFPIFIFTYIPISVVALFKKVEWKPIEHNVVKTIKEIR